MDHSPGRKWSRRLWWCLCKIEGEVIESLGWEYLEETIERLLKGYMKNLSEG